MAERIREIRPFEISYECDDRTGDGALCGGSMLHNGERLEVRPVMFKHVCVKCRAVKFLSGRYPLSTGLPVNVEIPEQWIDKLDREHVLNPPDPKPKIVTP